MKEIKLTQNKVAIVDDEDFEILNQFKWYLHQSRSMIYARRAYRGGKRENGHLIYMHRQILNVSQGLEVDHKNRNGLDNTKSNLRICSHGDNLRNAFRTINKTSKYKGVCWNPYHNKWRATISINNRQKHIGYFQSEIEAAIAFNETALKYVPEYMLLNDLNYST